MRERASGDSRSPARLLGRGITLGEQSKSETLVLFDQFRLGAVVRSHTPNDLERNTHTHVFEIAIVAHDIFDELVPSRPRSCPHPIRRDAIRKPSRRYDFQAIAVDCEFYVSAGEQVVAM